MLTIDVLTAPEQEQLILHETRIEQGFKTFFAEVGDALSTIQENRLYRAQFASFEEYCQHRWAIGADYARKLIRAAGTLNNLLQGNVSTLPSTESQARELAKLTEPAQQIEAWLDAVNESANGKPSAAQVQQAVERVQRRANPTPGQTATVISGKHAGQTVTVRKSENSGALVHCELPNGETYPFLAGELTLLPIAQPQTPIAPKPSLKQENLHLKTLLQQVISEAEGHLSPELLNQIRAVVDGLG